ncbi:hypothetical protein DFJ73DRAFT_825446 [Zopfochytrium polystomum]|nr:hypothetical protein DFJ73DRAFT_825446 [Zopfochytrium polystomum]
MRSRVFVSLDGEPTDDRVKLDVAKRTVTTTGDGSVFQFDGLFTRSDNAADVATACFAPLLEGFRQTYNCSLLIFGPSASIKIPRQESNSQNDPVHAQLYNQLVEAVFRFVDEQRQQTGRRRRVYIRMFQVFGDLVRDLADASRPAFVPKTAQYPDVSRKHVKTVGDAYGLTAQYRQACHSSSHTTTDVFIVELECPPEESQLSLIEDEDFEPSVTRFTIVKLFAAELFLEDSNRLIMREGPICSKSVFAFSETVDILSSPRTTQAATEPTTLTTVLSDELGGNALCAYIVFAELAMQWELLSGIMNMGQKFRRIENVPVKSSSNLQRLLERTLVRGRSIRSLEAKPGDKKTTLILKEKEKESEVLQMRLFDLSQRLASLEESNTALERAAEGSEREMLTIKQQLIDSRLEFHSLQEEYDRVTQQAKLSAENDGVANSARKEELAVAKKELEVLKEQYAQASHDKDIGAKSILQLRQQLSEKEKQCAALEKKCSELSLELVQMISNKGGPLRDYEAVRQEIERLRRHNEFLKRRLEQTHQNHVDIGDEMNRQLTAEEQKRRSFAEAKAELEAEVRALKAANHDLEIKMESSAEQMRLSMEQLQASLGEESDRKTDEIVALTEAIDALKRDADIRKAEMDILKQLVKDKESAIVKLTEKIETLQEEAILIVEEYRSKLERVKQDLTRLASGSKKEVKQVVNHVNSELLATYTANEKRLMERIETERLLRKEGAVGSATDKPGPASNIALLEKQIKEFTATVQFKLESERSKLMTRATVAEELLHSEQGRRGFGQLW